MANWRARVLYRLPISAAVTEIRETIGWTRKQIAKECGMGVLQYTEYEKNRRPYTIEFLERLGDATGIDAYVLAYTRTTDASKLPGKLPQLFAELRAEWEKQLKLMRSVKHLLPAGRW